MSKQGATSANALGVLAVMYSGFGCFLSWYRDTDDDANTLAAATATGLLYKSSGKKKQMKRLLGSEGFDGN
jgi:import inner membrane translocase subunit TIM23